MLKCVTDIEACNDRQTLNAVTTTPPLRSPPETKNKAEPKLYLVWVDEL